MRRIQLALDNEKDITSAVQTILDNLDKDYYFEIFDRAIMHALIDSLADNRIPFRMLSMARCTMIEPY